MSAMNKLLLLGVLVAVLAMVYGTQPCSDWDNRRRKCKEQDGCKWRPYSTLPGEKKEGRCEEKSKGISGKRESEDGEMTRPDEEECQFTADGECEDHCELNEREDACVPIQEEPEDKRNLQKRGKKACIDIGRNQKKCEKKKHRCAFRNGGCEDI